MSLPVVYTEPEEWEPPLTDPTAGLTTRERLFVLAYCGSARFNATQAAYQAGYQGTRHALTVTGHSVRHRPRVDTAIKVLLDREGAGEEECLARVTRRARASLADLFVIDATGKPGFNIQNAIESGAMDAVRKLKITRGAKGETAEIELHDPQAADALLLRVHGRLNNHGDIGLTDEQLIAFQQKVLDIITRHVSDDETLAKIKADFQELGGGTGEEDPDQGGPGDVQ